MWTNWITSWNYLFISQFSWALSQLRAKVIRLQGSYQYHRVHKHNCCIRTHDILNTLNLKWASLYLTIPEFSPPFVVYNAWWNLQYEKTGGWHCLRSFNREGTSHVQWSKHWPSAHPSPSLSCLEVSKKKVVSNILFDYYVPRKFTHCT